jgi:hypothetical protein
MSEQLASQSRLSSGISRRTALRGAAWSASAVTVVVATPNIAAASGGATGSGGTTKVKRQGNNLEVSSSITAGPASLTNVRAVVTVSFTAAGPSLASATVNPPWSTSGSVSASTATFILGPLAAGQTVSFKPTLGMNDASEVAGSLTIHYTWDGNADGDTVGGTFTKN